MGIDAISQLYELSRTGRSIKCFDWGQAFSTAFDGMAADFAVGMGWDLARGRSLEEALFGGLWTVR